MTEPAAVPKRIISMVPSWTETLIEAGVEVVGRTRFCIHPRDRVGSIPVVGGTKNVRWEDVRGLEADLLLLDREENPKSMAEQCPIAWMATDVRSVGDCARETRVLAKRLGSGFLIRQADEWDELLTTPVEEIALDALPGIIEWLRSPSPSISRFLYLIWRKPWIAVGPETFVGSMFDRLGVGRLMAPAKEKYPQVDLRDHPPETTALLFASEPYPFARRRREAEELPHAAAIVDGSFFSWFGTRALKFLRAGRSMS